MHNFEVITRDFLEHQAIVQIQSERELLPAIRDLLTNPRRAADMGKHAQQFVRSQQSVSEAVADRLWPLYHTACWRQPRGGLSLVSLQRSRSRSHSMSKAGEAALGARLQ